MLTSDERYAQQAESMRQALANAWTEGYAQGRLDSVDSMLGDAPYRTNPYVKEN